MKRRHSLLLWPVVQTPVAQQYCRRPEGMCGLVAQPTVHPLIVSFHTSRTVSVTSQFKNPGEEPMTSGESQAGLTRHQPLAVLDSCIWVGSARLLPQLDGGHTHPHHHQHCMLIYDCCLDWHPNVISRHAKDRERPWFCNLYLLLWAGCLRWSIMLAWKLWLPRTCLQVMYLGLHRSLSASGQCPSWCGRSAQNLLSPQPIFRALQCAV